MSQSNGWVAAFGRLLIVVIFFIAGYGKAMAPAGTIAYIAANGVPLPTLAYAAAVFIELPLCLALLLGWYARPAAGLLAFYCLVVAMFFHTDFSNHIQEINFLKNLTMAGGLLQIVAYGAGAISMDARRGAATTG